MSSGSCTGQVNAWRCLVSTPQQAATSLTRWDALRHFDLRTERACFPGAPIFGMSTRRTGIGRYAPERSSERSVRRRVADPKVRMNVTAPKCTSRASSGPSFSRTLPRNEDVRHPGDEGLRVPRAPRRRTRQPRLQLANRDRHRDGGAGRHARAGSDHRSVDEIDQAPELSALFALARILGPQRSSHGTGSVVRAVIGIAQVGDDGQEGYTCTLEAPVDDAQRVRGAGARGVLRGH